MRYEDIDIALSFLPFCPEGKGVVLLVDKVVDLPLVRRYIINTLGTPGTNLGNGMSYNRKWIYLRTANDRLEGTRDWIYPVSRASESEPEFITPEPFVYVNLSTGVQTLDRFSLWLLEHCMYDISREGFMLVLKGECKYV